MATKGDKAGKKEELPFEQALEKLEKIVEQLEGGELNLDKALASFEEGMALAKTCETRLDQATGRVEKIMKEFGGNQEKIALAGESEFERDADDPL
jgi:exodeoxyribonuclease VII small subunit